METSKPCCFAQKFEMLPPPRGHRVFVDVRRRFGGGSVNIEVEWIGDQDGKYTFEAIKQHNDTSEYPHHTLIWTGGHTVIQAVAFEDFATAAFRNAEAIRNTSKTTVE